LIRPDLRLPQAFNEALREPHEWFEEPDDLDRLSTALVSIDAIEDPVDAAATLAYPVTRAQAFGEANKRTPCSWPAWVLDYNCQYADLLPPPDDREVADLLVREAAGADVGDELTEILRSRRTPPPGLPREE
jgi:prophage maintenance system killer protein